MASMIKEVQESGPRATGAATGSLFRVVWRWHFYAGLIIAPVLMTVATTGALYIFRPELERLLRPELADVARGEARLDLRARLAVAEAEVASSYPGFKATALGIPVGANRPTRIEFEGGDRPKGRPPRTLRVYVDPVVGRVQGVADSETDAISGFFQGVLALHRRLFIGTTGRVVVELTTCWTMVMLATGLYLWWPRRREKIRGVWAPRWGTNKYTLLRDLHAVSGAYMFPVAFLIVLTGLWYTVGLGVNGRRAAENLERGRSIFADWPSNELPPTVSRGKPGPAGALSLDEAAVIAARRLPGKELIVDLPGKKVRGKTIDGIQVIAFNPPGSLGPTSFARLVLDRFDGSVLSETNFVARSRTSWWESWNYPLHIGSVLGLPTKFLWLAACLVLAGMPVTGLWMWWSRRPKSGTGFPRRSDAPLPRWLSVLVLAACVLLPTVGASVLLILVGEGVAKLVRSGRVVEPSA